MYVFNSRKSICIIIWAKTIQWKLTYEQIIIFLSFNASRLIIDILKWE